MRLRVCSVFFSLTFALCSCGRTDDVVARAFDPPGLTNTPDASSTSPLDVVLDMAAASDACVFGHRGILLDFGEPSMAASLRPGSLRAGQDELVEHQGATWLRVHSRSLTVSFYWPAVASDASEASVYAEGRVRGLLAHAVSVSVDGRTIGGWTLGKDEIRVVVARGTTSGTMSPGGHELALHFIGGTRASDEALAEIDWVHLGTGEVSDSYAAPTHADVAVDATVGGRSLRALSLLAPGFARCSGWIPANATLETDLATAGGGDADVEARLVRDRHPPIVLGTATVAGGAVAWAPWSVPVTGLEGAGALASIELVAKRAAKGTRVLLGSPRVVAAGSIVADAPSVARGVVLVVLGSTAARSLAPWGGSHTVPELGNLAAMGTTFLAHRASSSLANTVMASMLTGLSPRAHGLCDPDARLSDSLITVEEVCRQGGIATAMFTANPTTGAAFGFARGWDLFVTHDPLEEALATTVFDDAAEWIQAHKSSRFLVVVHARGGHPPWDATPDELKSMPPDGYFGIIDPRRAAEALTKIRKHPGRFKEDDRVRAWALYDHAIDAHDAALGRLMAALRNAGRDADTAVIVTADVAANEAAPVPFSDPDTLDEPQLAIPLVVRWPQPSPLAGRRVEASTAPVDLARTVLDALGLVPPSAFEGIGVEALAQGALVPEERPLLAIRGGRFSSRWGPYVLLGTRNHEIRMCDLSLDPSCVADVRGTSPLALEPLRRWTLAALAPSVPPGPPRTPALLDGHTISALVRWGRASDSEREDDF